MSMTRRARMQATLAGRPVDRPAFNFYEIDGYSQRPDDPDPFNIYHDPSWKPLLDLTREHADRIVRRWVPFKDAPSDPLADLTTVDRWTEHGSRFVRTTIKAGTRTLTKVDRRDPDVDTNWHIEHLLKDEDDAMAWLALPENPPGRTADPAAFLKVEEDLGETGIAMVDTPDPLCLAAELFAMQDYLVLASSEPALFHRIVERMSRWVYGWTEAVARALPGRLWRIVGPEYAGAPYLPPKLFREFVTRYDQPMIDRVHATGGFARLHAHGRLRGILDDLVATGCDGLDPIEPPPQGDVTLAEVKAAFGDRLVLFGNLEVRDIESLSPVEFRPIVERALAEGTAGSGRGFVLQPSAAPYGRTLSSIALRNYETIVRVVEEAFPPVID